MVYIIWTIWYQLNSTSTESCDPIVTILNSRLIRVNWIATTILNWPFFRPIRRRKFVEIRTTRKLVQTGSNLILHSDWPYKSQWKAFVLSNGISTDASYSFFGGFSISFEDLGFSHFHWPIESFLIGYPVKSLIRPKVWKVSKFIFVERIRQQLQQQQLQHEGQQL